MNIESIITHCVKDIEAAHASREKAIAISRRLIQQSAGTIRATHRGEYEQAAAMLQMAAEIARDLREVVADQVQILHAGYTQDSLKEYTEAALVYAFLTHSDPPDAATLGVGSAAYLNGLAEAASELRRAILDRLRRNDLAQSEELLAVMDDVYSILMTIDYPDALTGGLRRTTDALRAVLERTRGDLTNALRQEQLMQALRDVDQRIVPEEG